MFGVDVGTEVSLSRESCNWNSKSVVGEHGLSEWFTERTGSFDRNISWRRWMLRRRRDAEGGVCRERGPF